MLESFMWFAVYYLIGVVVTVVYRKYDSDLPGEIAALMALAWPVVLFFGSLMGICIVVGKAFDAAFKRLGI